MAPAKKKAATDALKVFDLNSQRARAFLRVFDGPAGRTQGQPSNDEKELLRGAVVFAVGALDGYLHELVLEIVPKYGGNQQKLAGPLRAIAKDDPSLALRLALSPSGGDKVAEFRDALDLWLSSKSFQGPEAVVTAMGYVGAVISWQQFNDASGVDAAARLTHFTKMRHGIVHRGEPDIKRKQADECVSLVEVMAHTIDNSVVSSYSP